MLPKGLTSGECRHAQLHDISIYASIQDGPDLLYNSWKPFSKQFSLELWHLRCCLALDFPQPLAGLSCAWMLDGGGGNGDPAYGAGE